MLIFGAETSVLYFRSTLDVFHVNVKLYACLLLCLISCYWTFQIEVGEKYACATCFDNHINYWSVY